jgi:beta-galactosidase/beta-glucuronidase
VSAATHPRPLLRRERWTRLDGSWDFAWDAHGAWQLPSDVSFDKEILVPFAPETPASGLGVIEPHRVCWYQRTFSAPQLHGEDRLMLNFGAVDHQARVWVNGHLAAEHEGGYTPFSTDVTTLLQAGEQVITVRAEDHPGDLGQPRGKQDWQPEPHVVWYPRTTGIWQTVWLEVVPAVRIAAVHWRADVPAWALDLEVRIEQPPATVTEGLELVVTLESAGRRLARDIYAGDGDLLRRRIGLRDGGHENVRSELLWSPESPTLIDASLTLRRARDGAELDSVESYTAMRSTRVERGRFLLNERPLQLRLVLDQGYWPQSGLTAPNLEAIERDIELTQELGFNGVRKHQKVEDPRFLRAADERGLLVWEELPSAYVFESRSIERLTRLWLEILERDRSHPCIVAWVCFNESWGVPNLPQDARQRDLVSSIYHLTRALDASRPVVGNDGWEFDAGELLCVHDYSDDAGLRERFARGLDEVLGGSGRRPGDHILLLDGARREERPVVLSEFGGITLAPEADADGQWGYHRVADGAALAALYARMLAAVHEITDLAGFCYTQLTDTYQETNGLLSGDREPKAPVAEIAAANRGRRQPGW